MNKIVTGPSIFIPSINRKEKGVLNVIEEEAKKDFFFFIKHILMPIAPAAFSMSEARHFHQMYNLINGDFNSFNLYQFGTYKPATNNDLHNKKLCLVPRMHGKTRVGTEAFSMWQLYRNPDLRILIISQTWNNSRKMLYVIKQYYERIRQNAKDVNSPNRIPGLILGNWIGDVWNEDNIYVRPRVNPDKTPSIATAGLGTEITSQHYDVVIGDDLIGEENSQTIDQLDKAKAEFGSLMEVGDYEKNKQTLFLLWGTRWHPQDLYKMIMDDLGRFYDTLVLRCWDNEENKTPLFPEKFTSQMLEAIRAEKLMSPHPMQWYLQWMNDSTPVSRSPFQEQYFKYYTADTKPKDMRVWLLIDPALTDKTYSCWTAIVPVGIDNLGRRIVLPYLRIKEKDPFKIAEQIITKGREHYKNGLMGTGIEDNGNYATLKPLLDQRAPWLNVMPLKPMNRIKDNRILSLQPLMITGKLLILNDMVDLKKEFLEFQPFMEGTTKDLLDALSYVNDVEPDPATYPVEVEDKRTPEEIHRDNFKSYIDNMEEEDSHVL